VVLEGRLKPISDYGSVEAVVGNPEIAYHLTRDCILYDPDHLLANLQPGVRHEYPRRGWVLERINYEQRGLTRALELRQFARQLSPYSEINILGYTFTFITALMCVATLRAPTTGSRMLSYLEQMLIEQGRPDLATEAQSVLGMDRILPAQLEHFLEQAAEAFDLAVQIKRSPHPFQHKINAHQQGYFLQTVRSMIDEGYTADPSGWLTPFYLTTHEIILADGPQAVKAKFTAQLDQFVADHGLETAEKREAAFDRAQRMHMECFILARQVAERYES
jgi:hypothetical protein